MPKFKDYNQNQSMLLPLNIKEWLPKDHICFIINDIVDNLDISCIEKTYSDQGSSAYSPRMLIKLMFYSYVKGIRSSRKIEDLSNENIVCRYLSANQRPDHGTINLFRKDHLKDLENLFAQIVILCDGLDIIDPTDLSIDGSVFKANASRKETHSRKDIKKIKKNIKKILEQAQKIDEQEDKKYGGKRGYSQMPKRLEDPETRQKEIERLKKKMGQLEEADKTIKEKQEKAKTKEEKELSGNSTHNITDPDAKLMKMKNGKTFNPAYNGQIATNNQVIVSYDITDDNVDTNLLLPMIDKSEKMSKKKVKIVKADSAYFSKSNIEGLKEKQIDGYIPDKEKIMEVRNKIPKYNRKNFRYNLKKDEFICPENKRLLLLKTDKGIKKYRCSDCNNCLKKSQCAKSKNRYISVDWQLEKYKTEMRKKLDTKKGKNKYLERMSDVEPPFGNIVHNQNARYFLCRGKPMVKIEFGLSCIAHNLIKISNWIKEKKNNNENIQLDSLMKFPAVV